LAFRPSILLVGAFATLAAALTLAAPGKAATTVMTEPASDVHRHDAQMHALVVSDSRVTMHIDWGTTTAYGNTLGNAQIGGDILGTDRSLFVNGLDAGTTYHYRVVVDTGSGTIVGDDASFQTAPYWAPVIQQLSFTPIVNGDGTPACACLSISSEIDIGGLVTTGHVEYGTTPALGTATADVPISTLDPSVLEDQWPAHWEGFYPTPAVTYNTRYYFSLVVANGIGVTRSPMQTFVVPGPPPSPGGGGAPPPSPPPPPPGRPGPAMTATITPAGAVQVVVGDTADFTAAIATNSVWPSFQAVHVSFALPGETGVCVGCIGDAVVDVVATRASSGACTDLIICDLGAIGANARATVTIRLRAKAPGDYRLVVEPEFGPSVTIPLTIVPRVADLAVDPLAGIERIGIRKTVVSNVTVVNNGPHAVDDAVVIIGSPRLVDVRAFVGAVACSTAPIHCPLAKLASGHSAAVRILLRGKASGRTSVRVGVASHAAGDPLTANNATAIVVRVIAQPRKARRAK
jgi:hypothetical protein